MLPLQRLIRPLRSMLYLSCSKRTFLPSDYNCRHQWDSRLSHEAFHSIPARDLGVKILKAAETGASVSPLDFDIFSNKLHELDVVATDFIESVIYRYAKSQSVLDVMESAPHAIVRAYIDFGQPLRVLNLAKQRASTAVFLDSVSANLLIDHFIDQHAWLSALDVIWELHLQEYFSPLLQHDISPVTVASTLYTCKVLLDTGLKDPEPIELDESQSSDDEVEYKFVKYVRNPNYDNLFDVDRSRLKLGFVLIRLSDLMEKRPQSFCRTHAIQESFNTFARPLIAHLRLFGLAYSDQVDKLSATLQSMSNESQLVDCALSGYVVSQLIRALEDATVRETTAPVSRGVPVLPSSEEVEACLKELQRLKPMADSIEDTFSVNLETFIHNGIFGDKECMAKEIADVEDLYKQFSSRRAQLWNEQLESARRQNIIQGAKQSLRNVLEEEELLSYFDKKHDIQRKAWLAPRTRAERQWSRWKELKQDLERHKQKQTKTF